MCVHVCVCVCVCCVLTLYPHRLDLVVEPWINGLWTPLADMLGMGGERSSHEIEGHFFMIC